LVLWQGQILGESIQDLDSCTVFVPMGMEVNSGHQFEGLSFKFTYFLQKMKPFELATVIYLTFESY
jgi:hypothetical protein